MAITVQELIGRIKLTGDEEYKQKLKAVDRAGKSLAETSLKTSLAGAAMIAGLAAGAAALGKQAFDAASSYEQVRQTLISLTGSAEIADRKLRFMRELAIPATATEQQLQAAGLQLEAMGVRLEKALPLAAKLQAAFQFDPEALEKAARIFGRLAAGDMPDVELLAGFGLNRLSFAKEGIKFDSQGKMLSGAREAMDALERVINKRFGNILDKMAGTASAKTATLNDKWQVAMRKLGEGIVVQILPFIEKLSDILDKLAKSDALYTWGKRFVNVIATITVAVGILTFGILQLATIVAALSGQFGLAVGLLVASFAVLFGGIAIALKMRELMKNFGAQGGGAARVPDDPEPGAGWGSSVQGQIAQNTSEIARNTAPILDWKRAIFGGGELGRMGITPAEFATYRRAGAGPITVQLSNARSMESWLSDAISQTVIQMKRQGML